MPTDLKTKFKKAWLALKEARDSWQAGAHQARKNGQDETPRFTGC